MAIPIGLVYGIIYYALLHFPIRKFNMATPGREPATTDAETEATVGGGAISPLPGAASANTCASRYIAALGGASNLTLVDVCTMRLRLSVADSEKVSEAQLKSIGARSVLKRGATNVQVIIGPEADLIADEIRGELEHPSTRGATPVSSARPMSFRSMLLPRYVCAWWCTIRRRWIVSGFRRWTWRGVSANMFHIVVGAALCGANGHASDGQRRRRSADVCVKA